jgi:maleate isomerase
MNRQNSAFQRLRIGLIVPSSNTTMEPDFHRALGSSCTVSTTRIFLEQVTREAEVKMLEEDLPRGSRLIRTTNPDVVGGFARRSLARRRNR